MTSVRISELDELWNPNKCLECSKEKSIRVLQSSIRPYTPNIFGENILDLAKKIISHLQYGYPYKGINVAIHNNLRCSGNALCAYFAMMKAENNVQFHDEIADKIDCIIQKLTALSHLPPEADCFHKECLPGLVVNQLHPDQITEKDFLILISNAELFKEVIGLLSNPKEEYLSYLEKLVKKFPRARQKLYETSMQDCFEIYIKTTKNLEIFSAIFPEHITTSKNSNPR